MDILLLLLIAALCLFLCVGLSFCLRQMKLARERRKFLQWTDRHLTGDDTSCDPKEITFAQLKDAKNGFSIRYPGQWEKRPISAGQAELLLHVCSPEHERTFKTLCVGLDRLAWDSQNITTEQIAQQSAATLRNQDPDCKIHSVRPVQVSGQRAIELAHVSGHIRILNVLFRFGWKVFTVSVGAEQRSFNDYRPLLEHIVGSFTADPPPPIVAVPDTPTLPAEVAFAWEPLQTKESLPFRALVRRPKNWVDDCRGSSALASCRFVCYGEPILKTANFFSVNLSTLAKRGNPLLSDLREFYLQEAAKEGWTVVKQEPTAGFAGHPAFLFEMKAIVAMIEVCSWTLVGLHGPGLTDGDKTSHPASFCHGHMLSFSVDIRHKEAYRALAMDTLMSLCVEQEEVIGAEDEGLALLGAQ